MLGQPNVEFKPAQHPGGYDSGHKNRSKHGGNHDIQKIVAGVKRGDCDHDGDKHVDDAGAGNVVIERLSESLDGNAARQVGHGDKSNKGRKQQ